MHAIYSFVVGQYFYQMTTMEGLVEETIEIKLVSQTQKAINVQLTRPLHDSEICAVTMDLIDKPFDMNGAKLDFVVFRLKPDYGCMQLSCNHRFNTAALLVHFVKNSMTCPVCRQGLNSERLSLTSSFAGEPWLEKMQHILGSELQNRDPSSFVGNMFRGRDGHMYRYAIWYNEPIVVPVREMEQQRTNALPLHSALMQDYEMNTGDEWSVELFYDNNTNESLLSI